MMTDTQTRTRTTAEKRTHGARILVRLVQWLALAIAALGWLGLFYAGTVFEALSFGLYSIASVGLVVGLEALTWRWSG